MLLSFTCENKLTNYYSITTYYNLHKKIKYQVIVIYPGYELYKLL